MSLMEIVGSTRRMNRIRGETVRSRGEDYEPHVVDILHLRWPAEAQETFMQSVYFKPLAENTLHTGKKPV